MRICLLCSGHEPYDERIFYKEARSLAKKYDDVWIIIPHSEYISKEKDGVKFLTIASYSRSWINRFKNIKKLYKVALNLNADIYHCHEPESLIVGTKLKKVLGCKIIFDSHEMYSATLAGKFPKFLHNHAMFMYKHFERTKIAQCDFALGATWAISDYLAKIVGHNRTETILNCSVPDIFGKVINRKWGKETIICHDGHLTFLRGLKTMVNAIEIVSKKHPIKFKIIGDVFGSEKEWLESYITIHNLENVIERTGWLDYREVGSAFSDCNIGLLALQKVPNHVIAAPNKIFNYMYFGLPFVSPDHCIDINKLIEEEKCGISVDSTSATSYANAISYLIEHREDAINMGLNAKKASEKKYNWTFMEKKLLQVYKNLEGN